MLSVTQLKFAARRLWAPVMVFSVVVGAGYGLQAVESPVAGPSVTQATR